MFRNGCEGRNCLPATDVCNMRQEVGQWLLVSPQEDSPTLSPPVTAASSQQYGSHRSRVDRFSGLQGLLGRCAQCEARSGPMAASAPPERLSAAFTVTAAPHWLQLPGLCHHQAWRLQQHLCTVCPCPQIISACAFFLHKVLVRTWSVIICCSSVAIVVTRQEGCASECHGNAVPYWLLTRLRTV